MKKMANMKKSVTSSIVLSVIILFSVSIIFIPSNSYAEEINVKSIGVERHQSLHSQMTEYKMLKHSEFG